MSEGHRKRAKKLGVDYSKQSAPHGRMPSGKPYKEPEEVRKRKNASQGRHKRKKAMEAKAESPSTRRLLGLVTKAIELVPKKFDPLLDLLHEVKVKDSKGLAKEARTALQDTIDELPMSFGMSDEERDEINEALLEVHAHYGGERETHPLVGLGVAVACYAVPVALAISETRSLLARLEAAKEG